MLSNRKIKKFYYHILLLLEDKLTIRIVLLLLPSTSYCKIGASWNEPKWIFEEDIMTKLWSPLTRSYDGMKLGFDRKTGQNLSITSRRSEETYLWGSPFPLSPTKQLWWRGNIFWSRGQWSNRNFANLKSPAYQKDFDFDYYLDKMKPMCHIMQVT